VKGIVPDYVMEQKKRFFVPPMRRWISCLFARYGYLLRGGGLVKLGLATVKAGAESANYRPGAFVARDAYALLLAEMRIRAHACV
jgi:hypothetical protein